VSEDRDKHSEAGKGDKAGLGHKLGRSVGARKTEQAAGMSQHIPDKVRAKVDGTEGKTVEPKGKKR
jgi:hypothetical protein